MNLAKIKSRPLHLMSFGKRELRTQFGALCWRVRKGNTEIALVTSRETGRWVIPKGWPQRGQTAHEAAATEAWEEAGLRGETDESCIGIYSYMKIRRGKNAPCVVAVFALKVTEEAEKWPESKQRKRRWVSPKKASEMVIEPELKRLLRDFDAEIHKAL